MSTNQQLIRLKTQVIRLKTQVEFKEFSNLFLVSLSLILFVSIINNVVHIFMDVQLQDLKRVRDEAKHLENTLVRL